MKSHKNKPTKHSKYLHVPRPSSLYDFITHFTFSYECFFPTNFYKKMSKKKQPNNLFTKYTRISLFFTFPFYLVVVSVSVFFSYFPAAPIKNHSHNNKKKNTLNSSSRTFMIFCLH